MKIIAIVITLVGLLITGISSIGIFYSIRSAISAMTSSASNGIGLLAEAISSSQTMCLANLFGVAITFFGVVIMIVAMFIGRKKQVIA